MLAPCIPFLLLFPTWALVGLEAASIWNTNELPLAFGIGIILYLGVTVMLDKHLTADFDKLSGRTTDKEELTTSEPAAAST